MRRSVFVCATGGNDEVINILPLSWSGGEVDDNSFRTHYVLSHFAIVLRRYHLRRRGMSYGVGRFSFPFENSIVPILLALALGS